MRHVASVLVGLLVAAPVAAQDMPLSSFLVPGEGWKSVRKELAPAHLFAGDKTGKPHLLDLVVTSSGHAYGASADPPAIFLVKPDATKRIVAASWGTARSNLAMVLSPDGGTLVVSDPERYRLTAFRVEKNGDLTAGEGYYALRKRRRASSGPIRMAFDRANRLYAATPEGVQIFDPTGRLCGALLSPERADVTAVALGGPDFDRLYVICGGKAYVRKIKPSPPPKRKK